MLGGVSLLFSNALAVIPGHPIAFALQSLLWVTGHHNPPPRQLGTYSKVNSAHTGIHTYMRSIWACRGSVHTYTHVPNMCMYVPQGNSIFYLYYISEFETLREQHKCTGMQVGRHVHTSTHVLLHRIWKLSTLLGDQCPISGQTQTHQSQPYL